MVKRTELDVELWRFTKRLVEVVMNDQSFGFFDDMALLSV